MSHPEHERAPEDAEEDPVEAVTRHIPVVIPLMGAALMFLLAAIAVGLA
jgi:hypothetical protein